MLKFILTGIFFFAISGTLLAQTDTTTFDDYLQNDKGKKERSGDEDSPKKDKPKSEFRERLSFGGNLGLSFGDVTLVNINPIAYYNVTERLDLGMSINYLYFKIRNTDGLTMYGLGPISRFKVVENIYALGEIDFQNFPIYEPFTNETTRQWVNGIFVGASYFQTFDGKSGAMISALYNLRYDQNRSPYASPLVIRYGFLF